MVEIDERTWKAVMQEVMAVSLIARQTLDGEDCIREYLDNEKVVARIYIYGAQSDIIGCDCVREYSASENIIAASKKHYIPTKEEWEEWDNAGSDFNDYDWLYERGMTE